MQLSKADKLYNVIVVGGGPIGMSVAADVAEKGYQTLVLEEHSAIGQPMHCAGLVSPRVIDITRTDSVISLAKSARIHPPTGEPLFLDAGEVRAAIIDRKKFDREMAQ